MKIEQLEQLVAIHAHGTISAAADALFISQPTVSRSMQALEAELGYPLLERSRNRVRLNEAGLVALTHAQRVLDDLQAMRNALADQASRVRTVRIGGCAPAPIWELTRRIVSSFPGMILSTKLSGEAELERAVVSGGVDLAILRRHLSVPAAEVVPLMPESLFVLVPCSHSLAGRDSLTWADLNGERFLIQSSIGFWTELVRSRMPDSEFVEQSDPNVFAQLVVSSPLLSFGTDLTLPNSPMESRRAVPVAEADASTSYFLASRMAAPDQIRAIMALF